MDPRVCDDIRSRLCRYAEVVEETRVHAAERSSFGRYRAGAPYFEQYPLRAALACGAAGNGEFLREFWDTYERITRELEAPAYAKSSAFREELYRDLIAYVEVYRTAVCCSGLGMGRPEDLASPALRDDIGVLLLELKSEFSLDGLEEEVAFLDLAASGITGTGCPLPETPSCEGRQQSGCFPTRKEPAGSR